MLLHEFRVGATAEPFVILTSESPRLETIVLTLGIPVELWLPDDEDEFTPPAAAGLATALEHRALARAEAIAEEVGPGWIVGIETAIVSGGEVIGAPKTVAEAEAMLKRLRGATHQVIGAIGLAVGHTGETATAHEITTVRLRDYSDAEIAAYLSRGAPLDRVGGYAIEDAAFRPVESWATCYQNVVGLPLCCLAVLLRQANLMWMPSGMRQAPQCAACERRTTLDCFQPLLGA